jgi:hypothetical protein
VEPGGQPELWSPYCGVYVQGLDLSEGAGKTTIWRIEATSATGLLPYRTVLGSVPPGFRATVPLQSTLERGRTYGLEVSGGEAFGAETTFTLNMLRPGSILDFAGGTRPAAAFVADTQCRSGTPGVPASTG